MHISTGRDLKQWRQNNHLTQEELAEKIHYSKYRISHIESADSPLSKKMSSAVTVLDNSLHPGNERVVEAWNTLCSYEFVEIKKKVPDIAKNLTELLTIKDVGDYRDQEAYLKFLSISLHLLSLIKHGNFESREQFKDVYTPLISKINVEARTYLNEKAANHKKV